MEEKLTIKQLLAILAAGLFSFCGVLIETATNITFPTLMNEFQVSTSLVQWMTTGNLLMMGILIPISSYLKRRFQTKKLFLVAGFLFSIGLIIDIFAQQFSLLLIGRLIQGAGVGIALPMMYNIILEESPQRLLGLMMGCGSFVTAAAPAIGPTFGGIMTQYFTWRYIFICVLPIIVLASFIGYLCMREQKINIHEKFDILSFIAVAFAFITLIMGFSNLNQVVDHLVFVLCCFIIGISSLYYFTKRQLHIKNPLIHLDIFNHKSFTFHTLAIMFLQMTTLGYGLLLPTFVQIVLKQPATDAGVILLPGAIVGALFAPVGGLILDRFGAKKPIILGICCSFISTICFLFLFDKLTYQLCMILYFIYSLGIGLIVGNTMTCAMSHLPTNLQADGNATLQTLMQLSGGTGTSITAAILAFVQQGTNLYDGTNRGTLFVLVFLIFNVTIVVLSQYFAFKGGEKNEF